MSKKSKLPDLETSLKEINILVEAMEKGDLTLDQSLNQFEKGITLITHAQKILEEAEQKIQILIKNNEEDTLKLFEIPQE